MRDLAGFLKAQCANGSAWNCSTLAADWCLTLDYPDFAAPWRDITDLQACERVPAQAGGLAELWRVGIGDALPLVDGSPQAGDIAVLSAHGYEAGGVFTGERWAIRAPRGLHFVPAVSVVIIQAWRP